MVLTYEEQKRMVLTLERYRQKMTQEERRIFDMMVKRQKDDEDFDEGTRKQLVALYQKYFPKHSKDELNKAWDQLFKSKD